MNAKDRKRLTAILANANALMNAGNQGNTITSTDIIEALIADVSAALGNGEPTETAELVSRDVACTCGKSIYLTHFKGCAVLVANFRARTADGHSITDGLAVWDYDLRPGYVSFKRLGEDGWFEVLHSKDDERGSMMNAERVCVRHPSSGQFASDALKGK